MAEGPEGSSRDRRRALPIASCAVLQLAALPLPWFAIGYGRYQEPTETSHGQIVPLDLTVVRGYELFLGWPAPASVVVGPLFAAWAAALVTAGWLCWRRSPRRRLAVAVAVGLEVLSIGAALVPTAWFDPVLRPILEIRAGAVVSLAGTALLLWPATLSTPSRT